MADIINSLPVGVLVGLAGILALVVLFIPITLRLAGLTGQQVADVLALTMQFFINLVKEFRTQNKAPP